MNSNDPIKHAGPNPIPATPAARTKVESVKASIKLWSKEDIYHLFDSLRTDVHLRRTNGNEVSSITWYLKEPGKKIATWTSDDGLVVHGTDLSSNIILGYWRKEGKRNSKPHQWPTFISDYAILYIDGTRDFGISCIHINGGGSDGGDGNPVQL